MAIYTVNVNASKMFYALINKCLDLHGEAWLIRLYGLKKFFPEVETEWQKIFNTLRLGINSSITWTGQSMTKSDTVPDETRVPAHVEVNESIIEIMNASALGAGVTLSDDYLFIDQDGDYSKAMATWTAAAKLYLDIMGIAAEFTMYRLMVSELYEQTGAFERSPGQLVPFLGCPIPLASGNGLFEKLNWPGLITACGAYYKTVIFSPVLEVFASAPGNRRAVTMDVVVNKIADPEELETQTIYEHISGWPICGVIAAIDSNGLKYNETAINYTGDKKIAITLAEPVETAPDSITFKIHTMEPL